MQLSMAIAESLDESKTADLQLYRVLGDSTTELDLLMDEVTGGKKNKTVHPGFSGSDLVKLFAAQNSVSEFPRISALGSVCVHSIMYTFYRLLSPL